jgi:hypothetical protein
MSEVKKANITPTEDFLNGFRRALQLVEDEDPHSDTHTILMEELQEMLDGMPPEKLGATGEFPSGKLTPGDEGALCLAIGVKANNVIIHMGMKPVSWFAMSAADAYVFGTLVQNRAYEADKEKSARAGGEVRCNVCGDLYRRHPMDHTILGAGDRPFLNRLCDGRRVKL